MADTTPAQPADGGEADLAAVQQVGDGELPTGSRSNVQGSVKGCRATGSPKYHNLGFVLITSRVIGEQVIKSTTC